MMSGQSYTRIFWDTNGEYIGHGMLFLSNRNPPDNEYFDVKKEKKGAKVWSRPYQDRHNKRAVA
jgi:hypothetical protein